MSKLEENISDDNDNGSKLWKIRKIYLPTWPMSIGRSKLKELTAVYLKKKGDALATWV